MAYSAQAQNSSYASHYAQHNARYNAYSGSSRHAGGYYTDGNAARAYEPDLTFEREQKRQKRMHAIKGGGKNLHPAISYSQALFFKAVFVCVVAIATVAIFTIWLNTATFQTQVRSAELTKEIQTAQELETSLELEHSTYTSPSYLRNAAQNLGMVVDTNAKFLTVDKTITLATYSNGKISIADTVGNIARVSALS